MAVDTIPSTPPTATVHQHTEQARQNRERRAAETTNREVVARQDVQQRQQQAQSDRVSDAKKVDAAKAAEQRARVDIHA